MIWNEWKTMTTPQKILRSSCLVTAVCTLVVLILYMALDFPKSNEIAWIIGVGQVLSGIEDWVYHYKRKWAIAKFIMGPILIAGYTYAAIVR